MSHDDCERKKQDNEVIRQKGHSRSEVFFVVVYLQQNKKRREPREKNVTIVRSRYIIYRLLVAVHYMPISVNDNAIVTGSGRPIQINVS